MKIPNKINMFGETINVIHKKDLMKRTNNAGEAHYRFNEIHISDDDKQDIKENTFFHEWLHLAFDKLGEKELRDNERVVGSLAGLLHQLIKDIK